MKNFSFKNEIVEKPELTLFSEFETNNEKPHFSFVDILIIPIVTILVYILAFSKMYKEGGNFFFFIVIASGIGIVTSLIRFIALCIRWYIRGNKIRKKNESKFQNLVAICEKKTRIYKEQMLECYPSPAGVSFIRKSPNINGFLNVRIGLSTMINPCRIIAEDESQKKIIQNYFDRITKLEYITDFPYVFSLKEEKSIGVYGESKVEITNAIMNNLSFFYAENDLVIYILDSNNTLSHYNMLPLVCYRIINWNSESDWKKVISEIYDSILSKPQTKHVIILGDSSYYDYIDKMMGESLENNTLTIISLCDSKPDYNCDMTIYGDNTECGIVRHANQNGNVIVALDLMKTSELSKFKLSQEHIAVDNTKRDSILPSYISYEDFRRCEDKYFSKNDEFIIPLGVCLKNGKMQKISLCLSDSNPHGIIGGATGKGKSELILSLVTSLALNYEPCEVNFAIVDFKGGSTSELVKSLPHCAGIASDLQDSGAIVRAISLLKTEATRRQTFLQNAVEKGIISKAEAAEYRIAYQKDPTLPKLPLLLIIVDEYDSLKKSYDKFAQELKVITKLGRSRFMYIILSDNTPTTFTDVGPNITYRISMGYPNPSEMGTVLDVSLDSNNSSYKIYKSNNNDQIFDDEEVNIVKGRGIIKDYNGVLRAFQAPFLRYELPNNTTCLNEIIHSLRSKYIPIGNVAKCIISDRLPKSYIGELDLLNGSFDYYKGKYSKFIENIPIGIYDNTANNTQPIFYVNPIQENILVSGTKGAGKTTALKTIIFTFLLCVPPKQYTVFICNFGNPGTYDEFKTIPHVADVLDLGRAATYETREKFERLQMFLEKMVQEQSSMYEKDRKKYLIVIDEYKTLSETPLYEKNFGQLIKDGKNAGLSFVISTTAARFISEVVRNSFYTRILLRNNEQEFDVLFNCTNSMKPNFSENGRAIVQNEEGTCFEMQVALPGFTSKENYKIAVSDFVRTYYSHNNYRAFSIPLMPINLSFQSLIRFVKTLDVDDYVLRHFLFGLNTKDLAPVSMLKDELDCLLIEGTYQSGKTHLVMNMISQIIYNMYSLIIINNEKDEYSKFNSTHTWVLSYNVEQVEKLISDSSEPLTHLYIVIDDYDKLCSFLASENQGLLSQLSNWISFRRKNPKIHFVLAYSAEANYYTFMSNFKKNETIQLGDKLLAQRFATPSGFQSDNFIIKKNHALVSYNNEISYIKLIN